MDQTASGQQHQQIAARVRKLIEIMPDPVARARLEDALRLSQELEAKATELQARLTQVAADTQLRPRRIGWLFRPNASPREKVFTLVMLGWLALLVYGLTGSFVPEPRVTELAAYAALPVCMAFFLPLLRDRHPSGRVWTYGPLKRFFFYVLVLAASYLVSWFGLSLGCASLATRIFGADITREVEVVWKSDGRWRRGCDYELKLRDVRSDWSTTTCVGKEFWSLVRRGDVLHAKGKGSGLGIMLVEYTFPDRR